MTDIQIRRLFAKEQFAVFRGTRQAGKRARQRSSRSIRRSEYQQWSNSLHELLPQRTARAAYCG